MHRTPDTTVPATSTRDHHGAMTRSAFLCESGQRLCREHQPPRTATVPVDGTFAVVSYPANNYCAEPVYLHAAGEPYWDGQRVGELFAMVGHGWVGKLPDGSHIYPGKVPQSDAARQLVTAFLAQ